MVGIGLIISSCGQSTSLRESLQISASMYTLDTHDPPIASIHATAGAKSTKERSRTEFSASFRGSCLLSCPTINKADSGDMQSPLWYSSYMGAWFPYPLPLRLPNLSRFYKKAMDGQMASFTLIPLSLFLYQIPCCNKEKGELDAPCNLHYRRTHAAVHEVHVRHLVCAGQLISHPFLILCPPAADRPSSDSCRIYNFHPRCYFVPWAQSVSAGSRPLLPGRNIWLQSTKHRSYGVL